MIKRYAEMRPDQLEAALKANPVFIAPWGALEWHGAHLPLGLDGLVAEAFCERLALEIDAVLLPSTWWPITTLPHAYSMQISTNTLCALWSEMLHECARVGAKTVCLVTGHYAQGHEWEMYRIAQDVMQRNPELRVIAASPLEILLDDELLDHAGLRETSQLLAVRPELVRTDLYQTGKPGKNAVLGDDPRPSTALAGHELFQRGVEAWKNAVVKWDRDTLQFFYGKRTAAYRPYRQKYFKGSWERAILDWWKSRSGDR